MELTELASEVDLPVEKTACALDLLDDGNTVAFITRYRKDQTGGLDEEQIRSIQQAAARKRMLGERKQAIRKSIELQGKLTAKLAREIDEAKSPKRLEDLYLPYKPKKQTLATVARQRGLEPLADEILHAAPAAFDAQRRAADFVALHSQLKSPADALAGVRHLLAERFSERADLRASLRSIFCSTGHLVSSRIEPPPPGAVENSAARDFTKDLPSSATNPSPEDSAASGTAPGLGGSEGEAIRAKAADGDRPPGGSKAGGTKKRRRRRKLEKAFQDYFDFREAVSRVPPHRVLAINRGERAKVLRVRVEGETEQMYQAATTLLVPPDQPHAEFLRECVRDALHRLILPSLEREIRREITEQAEEHAVGVFARNLRKLLLQPPAQGRRVLAIDPGFRSGCKLAALDEFGQLLQHELIYIVGSDELRAAGRAKVAELVQTHQLSVIAIGNGTACRETEQLVANVISQELADRNVAYVIVNEAGASVYSTSPLGREELPELDPVVRSAISIGRRLLDPLSELVKINPANIGVGMYQHDVKVKHLRDSLDAVVSSCVNFVGVDVNTASPALLSYVSGLNQLTARRLYEYRLKEGPFRRREQLRNVPGVGQATFVQAAGFLKISDPENPLDATWIHPESYDVARQLLERLGSSVEELSRVLSGKAHWTAAGEEPAGAIEAAGAGQRPASAPLSERALGVDLAAMAQELGVGKLLLQDMLAALARPGRDPRDDLPPPVFRTGIMKLDDLEPGMELSGTVLNVVDFGVFVDVGILDSALVHISRLADRYIRDPHDVVSVGDTLKVWVFDVEKKRRRVSLSAIPPETERKKRRKGSRKRDAAVGKHTPRAKEQGGKENRAAKTSPEKSPRKSRSPKYHRQKAGRPKKVAPPITQSMADGDEPMRSFSDLLQYYERKRGQTDQSGGSG